MKLIDLNPRWCGAGGEGVFQKNEAGEYVPAPERQGVGITFDCPCGCDTRCYVPFANPLDGGPQLEPGRPMWQRTGESFETLTLTPSILRVAPRACGWHGFITAGEVITC